MSADELNKALKEIERITEMTKREELLITLIKRLTEYQKN